MKITTKQLRKLIRKTVSESYMGNRVYKRKHEQLEEIIVENFFSKLGNKAATAIGMRGKEKEQINLLDNAKKAWDQVKGLWNITAFIKDMEKVGLGNTLAQPGWLSAQKNILIDKGWLENLRKLIRQLNPDKRDSDIPEMQTLDLFEPFAKDFAQAEDLATIRDPVTHQPTGVRVSNQDYARKVIDLSKKVDQIVNDLDNKYNTRVGELKKRLGQA